MKLAQVCGKLFWNSLVFISIFLLAHSGELQAQKQFQSTFGGLQHHDQAYGVVATSEGGYALTGLSRAFADDRNAYIVKTDDMGEMEWNLILGGIGNDRGREIRETSNGNLIVVGYTESYAIGVLDVYLVKTDMNGNVLWSKTYGGAGDDRGFDIQQTTDKGFIIAGYSNSYSPGGEYDAYLIKTDSSGELEWAKTYGGEGDDRLYAVTESPDGGFVATGRTNSFGAGDDVVYVIKVDSAGSIKWSRAYGGPLEDRAYGIARDDQNGGYVIAGRTESFGAGGQDAYILKIDESGLLEWSKTYGGTGNDVARRILQDSDGNFAFAGYSRSFGGNDDYMYMVKIDSDGEELWSMAYGQTERDRAFAIDKTHDKGFVIAGYSENYSGNMREYYMVKTGMHGSTACNELQISSFTSLPNTQIDSGGVERGGATPQTVISDSSEPLAIERSICAECATPDLQFFFSMENNRTVKLEALKTHTETYNWSLGDGDSSTGRVITHEYGGDDDIFEVCLSAENECGSETYCAEINLATGSIAGDGLLTKAVDLYPNPATNMLYIDFDSSLGETELKVSIIDLKGRKIKDADEFLQSGNSLEIDVSSFKPGIYIVFFQGKTYHGYKKLIVE